MQHLLDLLNLLQTSEALAIVAKFEDNRKVHLAQAKLALKPLITASAMFLETPISPKEGSEEVQASEPAYLSPL